MSGQQLEKLAIEKLTSSRGIFSSLFSFPSPEDIADLFHKAGNSYILEKKFHDAVRCYMKAYTEYNKLAGYDHYAMKNLSLAVTYAKQTNAFKSDKLIECYTLMAQNYGINGKMKEHNDQYLNISNIYEIDCNLLMALSVLDNCVDLNNLSSDEVIKRKSELLIKQNKYIEASKIYDQLIDTIINRDKKITSCVTCRQYSLLSVLCCIASNDLVSANNKCEKFNNLDDMFDTSYEGQLAINTLRAIETQNIADFELACENYNRILKLKPLHTALLTIAKKYILEFDDSVNQSNDYNESDFC